MSSAYNFHPLYVYKYSSGRSLKSHSDFSYYCKQINMISRNRNVVLLLLWVVLFMTSLNGAAAIGKHDRVFVNISNEVGQGLDLTFSCKSKNDDLGSHTLVEHGFFVFNFKPNYWGTTKFYCKFDWKDNHYTFDIYDYSRDKSKGPNYNWQIKTTGACVLYTGAKDYECNHYDIIW